MSARSVGQWELFVFLEKCIEFDAVADRSAKALLAWQDDLSKVILLKVVSVVGKRMFRRELRALVVDFVRILSRVNGC